jgi:sulfofructose kinase
MTVSVACVGLAVHDQIFRLDGEFAIGSKNFASSVSTGVGGPAVGAAMAVAGLGGTALAAVRVGGDAYADAVVAELETAGVDASCVERLDTAATSLSSVTIHGIGERTIVNHTDPALVVEAGRSVDAAVDAADVVLTDVRWVAGARRAAIRARQTGTPVVVDLDLSSDPEGRDLIALATHVVFSRGALSAWFPGEPIQDALLTVARETDAVVGVTLGASGSMWVVGTGIVKILAIPVPVVSTLGAGDVFHGAFALAIGENKPVRDAARFATTAAGLWCTFEPGSGNRLSREDVDRMEVEQWDG